MGSSSPELIVMQYIHLILYNYAELCYDYSKFKWRFSVPWFKCFVDSNAVRVKFHMKNKLTFKMQKLRNAIQLTLPVKKNTLTLIKL